MKRNRVMYENVRVEMARNNLTILDIAQRVGMNRETHSRKLSGRSPLNLNEAFDIQRECFPNEDVRVLFKECTGQKLML